MDCQPEPVVFTSRAHEREAVKLICALRSDLSSLEGALRRSLCFGPPLDEAFLGRLGGRKLEVLRAEYEEMLDLQTKTYDVPFEPAFLGDEHGKSVLLECAIEAMAERLLDAYSRVKDGRVVAEDWACVYDAAKEIIRRATTLLDRMFVQPHDARQVAAFRSAPLLRAWVLDDAERLLIHAEDALIQVGAKWPCHWPRKSTTGSSPSSG